MYPYSTYNHNFPETPTSGRTYHSPPSALPKFPLTLHYPNPFSSQTRHKPHPHRKPKVL
ncbi:hypothetical protein M501DRAFT_996602 [Patellaria atrata CBS 101060]|uniref:Uncharacterized protein n=1 Tax=Patellaria atrata CBS 101060 TaxID=1346257 RepID=A0A9P4S583_9PEZI|nr:hypothetical protein M501DRAFT_996602 [Patellaria atrata CBS 101060]